MPRYLVPYTPQPVQPSQAFPTRTQTLRPLLPVILANRNLSWSCYALVDSGADDCVFPYSFGTYIGLKVPSGRRYPFSGVGSHSQRAYFFQLQLMIPARPRAIRLRIPIGFTKGLEAAAVGILGQNGFFDRFRVSFDLQRGIFVLET